MIVYVNYNGNIDKGVVLLGRVIDGIKAEMT